MKPKTRDNLIYLAVGLGIAALITADAFYAVSRDREIWMPSIFAMRAVGYTAVLGPYVARETLKAKAKLAETIVCVVLGCMLQVGIAFAFRQTFSGRSTMRLYLLFVLGAFLIVRLMVLAVTYLGSKSHGA